MALTVNHPLNEDTKNCYMSSLGATPAPGYVRAPFRAKIVKVGVIQNASVTGSSVLAWAINGTAVTGGSITITGGAAGTIFTAVPTGANNCVEDDVISVTPSGGTGAAITGMAFTVFRAS